MVRGCFWGKRKGPLVPITQNINKTGYSRLLSRYLFPVSHQMISLGIQLEDLLFTRHIVFWIGSRETVMRLGPHPLFP